jgi:hypothetical protein
MSGITTADRPPPTRFAAELTARGWWYQRFSIEYRQTSRRELGEDLTLTEKQFKNWIHGRVKTRPQPKAAKILEVMFPPWTVTQLMTTPTGPPEPASAKIGGVPRSDVPWSHPDRGLGAAGWIASGVRLDSIGQAQVEGVLMMSAHESADHAGQVGAAGLDAESIDGLREQVVWLARSYALLPPLVFHQRAAAVRALIYRMVERTRRPGQSTDLYVLAGQICGLMAAAAFDLGCFPAATEQARAAFTYGQVAGHDGVRAYARGLQAVVCYWDGRPREAVDLATSAAPYAATGTSGTRLACVQARAWACLGAETQTRQAITTATATRESSQGIDEMYDEIGGEFGFSPAREQSWYGTALLTIGDAQGSAAHNRRTLDLVADATAQHHPLLEPGLEAHAHADLATAHLHTGDLDATLDALAPLWDIPDTERRTALTGRLRIIGTTLTGTTWRTNTQATALRDRLEHYTTAAAQAHALPT